MDTKIIVLNMSDVPKDVWNKFIGKSIFSTVFHTQEWMKTLHEAYGYEPKYLIEFSETNDIIAAIPFMIDKRFGINNYFSMPYDTYGGVIGSSDNIEKAFMNLSGIGVRYYVNYKSYDISHGGELLSTEVLNMRDCNSDIIFNNIINKTNRTAIKSAIKNNVVINESKESVTIFDKVDQVLVDSIVRNMVPSGLCKIYLGKIEGEAVVASIFFIYNNMTMYWANTTTELGRKTNANYLLLWTAIKYSKDEAHCLEFNFGASPPNADSLLKFKKSWGTETYQYIKNQKIPIILYPIIKIREKLQKYS